MHAPVLHSLLQGTDTSQLLCQPDAPVGDASSHALPTTDDHTLPPLFDATTPTRARDYGHARLAANRAATALSNHVVAGPGGSRSATPSASRKGESPPPVILSSSQVATRVMKTDRAGTVRTSSAVHEAALAQDAVMRHGAARLHVQALRDEYDADRNALDARQRELLSRRRQDLHKDQMRQARLALAALDGRHARRWIPPAPAEVERAREREMRTVSRGADAPRRLVQNGVMATSHFSKPLRAALLARVLYAGEARPARKASNSTGGDHVAAAARHPSPTSSPIATSRLV
jgi:hypothetical protein